MIKIDYENLRDATVNGVMTFDTSYPVNNLKILNKNKPAKVSDSGNEMGSAEYVLPIFKTDIGKSRTVTRAALDIGGLTYSLSTEAGAFTNISSCSFILQGADNYTFTTGLQNIAFFTDKTIGSYEYQETLNGIYDIDLIASITKRYYRLVMRAMLVGSDHMDWSLSGNINNVYFGSAATLPCPELKRKTTISHGVTINDALGGGRSGYYTHSKRRAWTVDLLLSETQKEALEAMDDTAHGGALPVYFEEEGMIDPIYARVTSEISYEQDAYRYYRATLTIEEEL